MCQKMTCPDGHFCKFGKCEPWPQDDSPESQYIGGGCDCRTGGDKSASALSMLAFLTQILVTLSVLAGLLMLVRLIARSLALLRAIGAPQRFVFAVVWSYSASLIVTGSVLGLASGWLAARLLSAIITRRTEVLVTAQPGWHELHLVLGFISLTLILALLPAIAATKRTLLSDLRP